MNEREGQRTGRKRGELESGPNQYSYQKSIGLAWNGSPLLRLASRSHPVADHYSDLLHTTTVADGDIFIELVVGCIIRGSLLASRSSGNSHLVQPSSSSNVLNSAAEAIGTGSTTEGILWDTTVANSEAAFNRDDVNGLTGLLSKIVSECLQSNSVLGIPRHILPRTGWRSSTPWDIMAAASYQGPPIHPRKTLQQICGNPKEDTSSMMGRDYGRWMY
ncbi:hypothetical protein ASPBRDRAFT_62391 [Aspergillus brasiliensis CBS 101740]|uniref:Uncharacterized protein n=1 Tax=Aspergillus brasiliensis (strain CBS 101740 / IMI 381727 / IBT 21946) TaxID=767769 RepID=A0A1L9UWU1_ASPBC|nr:hypothetical protein ASPBRDRAFT_62391 [Aspergillus brasiliensis CBS 101740]